MNESTEAQQQEKVTVEDTLQKLNHHLDMEQSLENSRNLKNEAAKLKRLNLKESGNVDTFHLPAVKKFQNEMAKYMADIDKNMNNRMDRRALVHEAEVMADGLKVSYRVGLENEIKRLTNWQKEFKQAFTQEHINLDDPQREALKRQDFDTSLEAMNDNELEEYVETLDERPLLSAYELNKLMIATKSNQQLHNKLIEYKTAHHFGEEYKNEPEWKKVAQVLFTIKGWRNGGSIWYLDLDNNLRLFNLQETLRKKLAGYTVSDPSQRQWR